MYWGHVAIEVTLALTHPAKPIVPTGQPSTDAAVGSEARTVAVTFPQFDETNGQIRLMIKFSNL